MDGVQEPTAQQHQAPPATAARIYDYLLGGVHNFPADREVAEKVIAALPNVREAAMANRAFLGRAVRYLADQGIDQFLDIGAGIPTQRNVHEILNQIRPQARVVYVDIDPLAVAESLDLLDGDPRSTAIRGDVRDPGPILAHPQVRGLLDLDQPVGLLLIAVLHFVPDDAVAYPAVEHLTRALAPGSYLAVTHGSLEGGPDQAGTTSMGRAYDRGTMTGAGGARSRSEVERFFTGWEIVEPGIVGLSQWHPDLDDRTRPADSTLSVAWAGVGRKVRHTGAHD